MDNLTEVTDRVTLYDDGVYRWTYEMDLQNNRFMYIKVLKILGMVSLGIVAVCMTMGLFLGSDAFGAMAGIGLGSSALMLLIWVIAYGIWTMISRGRYRLYYQMTGTAVAVLPTGAKQKRFAPFSQETAASGDLPREVAERAKIGGKRGRGITPFSMVLCVEPRRDQDVIDLKCLAGGTQVYVRQEDYEFILQFVQEHCRHA